MEEGEARYLAAELLVTDRFREKESRPMLAVVCPLGTHQTPMINSDPMFLQMAQV